MKPVNEAKTGVPGGGARERENGSVKRRRYSAPRILFHEPLEVVASTCTSPTSKGNPGTCPEGPIQS